LVYYHSLDGASVLVFTELVGKSSSSFCWHDSFLFQVALVAD